MSSHSQLTVQIGPFKDPMFTKDFQSELQSAIRQDTQAAVGRDTKVKFEWSKNGSKLRNARGIGDDILVEVSKARFSFGEERAQPDRFVNVHFPEGSDPAAAIELVTSAAQRLAERHHNFGVHNVNVITRTAGINTVQAPITLGR